MRHALGYIADSEDKRDHLFRVTHLKAIAPSFSLESVRPAQTRLDQENIGSCVANGVAGAVLFHQPDFLLSRLWLYYKTRAAEHTVAQDAGCMVRDAIKVIAKKGAPPESSWPYQNVAMRFSQRPPAGCTALAKKEVVSKYERILDMDAARACIASGNPYIVGFDVFKGLESDEAAATGRIPMPAAGETPIGGHCVLGWGYTPEVDTCLNSWGPGWGDNGLMHFPRGYGEKYASDMWTITSCAQT